MYGAQNAVVLEDILKCKTPDCICRHHYCINILFIVSTSIVAGLDKAIDTALFIDGFTCG